MTESKISIHESVQERYASIAVNQAASCCSPSAEACDCGPELYDATLINDLPIEVTGLSLGCGDPVTIASLSAGETVLDLGSGGGIDCFLAARQVGASGRVIGVDMTPEMLERANANKANLDMPNVEFRLGRIEALPVEDATVDVILSNCVINLSPDKMAVFQEAFRVLKPGGRISVSDIVSEGEFSDELRADAARWAECVSGAIDSEVYLEMLSDAGFEEIRVTEMVPADDIVDRVDGMPAIFSARIAARKP